MITAHMIRALTGSKATDPHFGNVTFQSGFNGAFPPATDDLGNAFFQSGGITMVENTVEGSHSASFSPTSGYLSVTNNPTLMYLTLAWTIEILIEITSTPTTNAHIMSKRGASSAAAALSWEMYLTPTNRVELRVNYGSGGVAIATADLPLNKPLYIAFDAYNTNSTQYQRAYVNGALQNAGSFYYESTGGVSANTEPLRIGTYLPQELTGTADWKLGFARITSGVARFDGKSYNALKTSYVDFYEGVFPIPLTRADAHNGTSEQYFNSSTKGIFDGTNYVLVYGNKAYVTANGQAIAGYGLQPPAFNYSEICYGNGVMLVAATERIQRSTDGGQTWQVVLETNGGNRYTRICWTGTQFVAANYALYGGQTNLCWTSPTGASGTWSQFTYDYNLWWAGLAANDTVIVRTGSFDGNGKIGVNLYSDPQRNINLFTAPTYHDIPIIRYLKNTFIAASGKHIFTSVNNGTSWNTYAMPHPSNSNLDPVNIIQIGEMIVIKFSDSTPDGIVYSYDTVNWMYGLPVFAKYIPSNVWNGRAPIVANNSGEALGFSANSGVLKYFAVP
jgi:hypothetical protein